MQQNTKIRILCVLGTRPELIKMMPIIWQLKKSNHFHTDIINTAQHQSLLADMLTLFNLTPNIDLHVMQENQTLATLTGNLFLKLGNLLAKQRYQLILGQGDTTTTWVTAQTAFYNNIPFGHIEAGLRTFDFANPFPEEMNRVFIAKLAALHFCPTMIEKNNLKKEGVVKNVFITGNTGIDTLYYFAKENISLPFELPANKRIILLTTHRRESFGQPLREIFTAFLQLTKQIHDIHIIYPVHPNPNVHELAYRMLSNHPAISLVAPLRYDRLVALLKQTYLVCTDSGGLQEEAPALNKPVIILRDVTERPLVVSMGLAKIAGVKTASILQCLETVLTHPEIYQGMQQDFSPYGDGHAAEKTMTIICEYLSQQFVKQI